MENWQKNLDVPAWVPGLFLVGQTVLLVVQLLVFFGDWTKIPAMTIAVVLTSATLWVASRAQGAMRRRLIRLALINGVIAIFYVLMALDIYAGDLAKWL